MLALLALLACARAKPVARAPELPASALARAERAADAVPRDAGLQARAGFLRLLIASDPRGAGLRFGRALAAAPAGEGEAAALALAGQAEIADEQSSPEALELWARALERLPRGAPQPLSELCAQRLLDLRGQTRLGDERILALARTIDAEAARGRGLPPRAAHRLREAQARIEGERAADAAGLSREVEAWRALGAVQRWRVAGPFAALRLRPLGVPLAVDGDAVAPAPSAGPAGPTFPRALDFPDGDVGLDAEPPEGDLYLAASVVTLSRGGRYLAVVEGAAALELRLDGAAVLARSPWPREMPRVQEAAVELPAGPHAVLVRWSRAEGSRFRVSLIRADGAAFDGASIAPARIEGARASAPCALGAACAAGPRWDDDGGLRGAAERALERDPADVLAAWFLVRATGGDDRPAARRAVEALLSASGGSAPALALRAAAVEHDFDVPERLARSRALADLAEAARKDPLFVRARLGTAELQRESERYQEAGEELDRAEQALRELRGPSARGAEPALPDALVLARARLLEAQGNAARALALSRGVLARLAARGDSRCEAARLASELARREGGPRLQAELAAALAGCDGGVAVRAGLLRDRGELGPLEELLALWAAARPAQPSRLEQVAEAQVARRRFAEAERTLQAASALAPRAADPLRRLAGVFDLAGDRAAAERARREALRRAPGDLALRRQLAVARGEELVPWAARDGRDIARRPSPPQGPGEQRPSALHLLDQAAVQLYPDGGGVERVHSVIRVLDKRGIGRYGEVQVPADAEVLELRTLKRDGRALEPESIPEKETVSLPGLEPGDAVELEYLRGIAPRGPDLPGLSLGPFYFRDEDAPMLESVYEARAPAAAGLEVDAHNLGGAAPRVVSEGGETRISFSARDVRSRPAEPSAPPESETLPWLQVGTGAGQAELVAQLADWIPLRTRPNEPVDALAAAARGSTPRETALALYQAVAQAVRGRSNSGDFGTTAAHVLAQGRGNRLVLLRAALASAGIASRVALVRPFAADPAPYRFPRGDLFTGAVLRIDLPEGPTWVDPTLRLAPFGRLPAWARGQPAWIVPDPGEAPRQVRIPEAPAGEDGRSLSFALRLDAEGNATGTARDVHRGFDAASLQDVLERIDADQRKQAIESMLGRALRDVALDDLQTEGEGAMGGDVTLSYALHGGLGARDGDELRLPASTFPARLQRRWLEKAERALPLLVDQPERSETSAALTLPAGFHLRATPPPVRIEGPFGRYAWEAREEGGVLRVRESFFLPQQRVPPARYADFGAFLRAIDDAQAQELRLSR